MARLLERYRNEIVPVLQQRLGRKNVLSLPRLEKIVLSAGLGKAHDEPKRIEAAVEDFSILTGQKPILRRPRRASARSASARG